VVVWVGGVALGSAPCSWCVTRSAGPDRSRRAHHARRAVAAALIAAGEFGAGDTLRPAGAAAGLDPGDSHRRRYGGAYATAYGPPRFRLHRPGAALCAARRRCLATLAAALLHGPRARRRSDRRLCDAVAHLHKEPNFWALDLYLAVVTAAALRARAAADVALACRRHRRIQALWMFPIIRCGASFDRAACVLSVVVCFVLAALLMCRASRPDRRPSRHNREISSVAVAAYLRCRALLVMATAMKHPRHARILGLWRQRSHAWRAPAFTRLCRWRRRGRPGDRRMGGRPALRDA